MKLTLKLLAFTLASFALTSCYAQTGTLQTKPTATTPAGDDWLLVQGTTNGIRKLAPTYYQTAITAGTTLQYWRGDKTWQTLNKGVVGLGNVNDTADTVKPISFPVQAALDLKADITALAASLQKTNNLSDLTAPSTARTNLGLGTLATQNGTFSGTSSGTNTGDQTTVSGNAGTATSLQTSRNINGTAFNGTANITIPTLYTADGTISANRAVAFSGVSSLTYTASAADGTTKLTGKSIELAMSAGATGDASLKLSPYYSAADGIQIYNGAGGAGYMRVGAGASLGNRFAISPPSHTAGLYITQLGTVAILNDGDSVSDGTLAGMGLYVSGPANFQDEVNINQGSSLHISSLASDSEIDAAITFASVVVFAPTSKVNLPTVTVASFPTSVGAGCMVYATNLVSTVSGTVATGGGTGKHLCIYDGTNWIVQ